MTLVAGASYGLGWTYNKRFLRGSDLGGLSLPAAQLTVAAAQMVVVLLVWWATVADRLPAPWSVHAQVGGGSVLAPLLAVLVLGVMGTGIAFSLQFDVMREAGPTVGASVTYLIPVVSVALGVLALHERLQWPQLLGAGVVIGAALLIGRPPARRRARRRRRSAGRRRRRAVT